MANFDLQCSSSFHRFSVLSFVLPARLCPSLPALHLCDRCPGVTRLPPLGCLSLWSLPPPPQACALPPSLFTGAEAFQPLPETSHPVPLIPESLVPVEPKPNGLGNQAHVCLSVVVTTMSPGSLERILCEITPKESQYLLG